MTVERMVSKLKTDGFDVVSFSEIDFEVDGEIDFGNDYSIQVGKSYCCLCQNLSDGIRYVMELKGASYSNVLVLAQRVFFGGDSMTLQELTLDKLHDRIVEVLFDKFMNQAAYIVHKELAEENGVSTEDVKKRISELIEVVE